MLKSRLSFKNEIGKALLHPFVLVSNSTDNTGVGGFGDLMALLELSTHRVELLSG
jgi:hypothetical protein